MPLPRFSSRWLAALTASLVVLAVLVSTSVEARSEDSGRDQLLLVPDTPQAQRALKRSKVEVVASYEAFELVLARGDDARRLRRAGADRREDMRTVQLAGGSVDPTQAGDRDLKQGNASARGLAVVQFVGPVKQRWLKALRKQGVRVVAYVPQNAYVIAARRKQLQRLAARAGDDRTIRAVTAYTARDKVARGAEKAKLLAVQTLAGEEGDGARRRAREHGRDVRAEADIGPYRTVYVSASSQDAAEQLAEDPGVVAVMPYHPPKIRDERASQIAAGNLANGQPVLGTGATTYLGWLASRGFNVGTPLSFVVDVTDEGIDNGKTSPKHPDFYRSGSTANPSRVAYLSNYTSDDGKRQHRDCGGHGTINASIAAGYNDRTGSAYEDSQGFNYGLGVAPQALLGSSKIFRCKDGNFGVKGGLARLTSNAYANGARISSNSWGSDVSGAYTSDSYLYDTFVRDAQPSVSGNQQMVEVFAGGNAGPDPQSIGSPATAKNVIAVGASESVRPSGTDGCQTPNAEADNARDITSYSSRGPTDDGRIKPDLVAPGSHLTGAAPQHGAYSATGVCNKYFPSGNTLYSLSSGTSHSTPVVSGAAALVRDFYTRTQGTPPSPAMTKALLVNGATDVAGSSSNGRGVTGPAPNSDQGWGLVNLGSTLDNTGRSYVDQTSIIGASGTRDSRTYSVVDSSKPVKVTLVWTDAPGFPGLSAAYVNDLNLEVTRNSLTYKGNNFSGGVSVTGGSADSRNNVERVVLPAGTTGSFTLDVVAATIAGDGVPGAGDSTDQDYAVIVSNASPS